MRAACAIAMVASLLVFTGCCSIGGTGCGDNGGGIGYQGSQNGGFFGGGCDSSGTSGSFSDSNCGPMCGAYLSDGQSGGGCGCNDCQMGQSYLRSQFNGQIGGQISSWFAGINSRPIGGRLAGAFAPGCGSDGGYVGCDSGDCGSDGGYQMGGGLLGSCRGLGTMVGCGGCRECGGNAIGLNHSDSAGPNAGGGVCGGCGVVGCGGGCLKRLIDSRRGRSHHPYGGEIPHTATAAGAAGGGAGGSAPAYSYPYYTTRGPRDFLMMNPPSIGR